MYAELEQVFLCIKKWHKMFIISDKKLYASNADRLKCALMHSRNYCVWHTHTYNDNTQTWPTQKCMQEHPSLHIGLQPTDRQACKVTHMLTFSYSHRNIRTCINNVVIC